MPFRTRLGLGPRSAPHGRNGRQVTDGVRPRGAAVAGRGRLAMLDRASVFTVDGASPVTRWHVALGDGLQEEVYWVVGACGVRTGCCCLGRLPLSWGGCVALCGAPSGPGPGGEGWGILPRGALSGSPTLRPEGSR